MYNHRSKRRPNRTTPQPYVSTSENNNINSHRYLTSAGAVQNDTESYCPLSETNRFLSTETAQKRDYFGTSPRTSRETRKIKAKHQQQSRTNTISFALYVKQPGTPNIWAYGRPQVV